METGIEIEIGYDMIIIWYLLTSLLNIRLETQQYTTKQNKTEQEKHYLQIEQTDRRMERKCDMTVENSNQSYARQIPT